MFLKVTWRRFYLSIRFAYDAFLIYLVIILIANLIVTLIKVCKAPYNIWISALYKLYLF